jgi:NADH-quinone oxidoreductase subunit J
MPVLLFYFFAALTLAFGAAVVMARNPVTSALCLAVSFVGLAALFLGLDAFFIATIQVLVYAGAVMVLFLFIIMLMDVRAEEASSRGLGPVMAGLALAVVLLAQMASVSGGLGNPGKGGPHSALETKDALTLRRQAGVKTLATIDADLAEGRLPDAKLVGESLFGQYAFHLQIVGLLLTVSTVGVVALSRKDSPSPQS